MIFWPDQPPSLFEPQKLLHFSTIGLLISSVANFNFTTPWMAMLSATAITIIVAIIAGLLKGRPCVGIVDEASISVWVCGQDRPADMYDFIGGSSRRR